MSIEQYKEQLQKAHCLVVGDLMLDEYIYGDIKRISPEAPVPVINMQECKYLLGGAANVAANISSLGAKATLVGIVGNNSETVIFKDLLGEKNVAFEGVISSKRVTTIKTRILGKNQQLLRIDKEQTSDIDDIDEELLVKKIKKLIKYVNAVVISDYCKGVCTERICRYVIELANKHNKYVFVDPKISDWARYSGASILTPNFFELNEASGQFLRNMPEDIIAASRVLLSDLQISNILVTRSQDGMMLVNNTDVYNFHTEAQEVFDVSGAGDTVVAAAAAFLSAGADLVEAVKISNIAAGIAVSKVGTYNVTFEELALKANGVKKHKLLTSENAVDAVKFYKRQGKKIVFTNGCFDILHIGHITLLSKAKQLGGILIIGLNSDKSVRRLKGNGRPVNSENDRAQMLAALEAVDMIVIFNEDTPYNLIKDIAPDILVKGSDYTTETVAGHDVVIDNGGQVVLLPLVEGKSTSDLIQTIRRKTS